MAAVVRSSSRILCYQRLSPYVNVYGPAPQLSTPTKIEDPDQKQAPPQPDQANQHTRPPPPTESPPHAHIEPPKWIGPQGYGCRHIHDKAPFTLWNADNRRFLPPTNDQSTWIYADFSV